MDEFFFFFEHSLYWFFNIGTKKEKSNKIHFADTMCNNILPYVNDLCLNSGNDIEGKKGKKREKKKKIIKGGGGL